MAHEELAFAKTGMMSTNLQVISNIYEFFYFFVGIYRMIFFANFSGVRVHQDGPLLRRHPRHGGLGAEKKNSMTSSILIQLVHFSLKGPPGADWRLPLLPPLPARVLRGGGQGADLGGGKLRFARDQEEAGRPLQQDGRRSRDLTGILMKISLFNHMVFERRLIKFLYKIPNESAYFYF